MYLVNTPCAQDYKCVGLIQSTSEITMMFDDDDSEDDHKYYDDDDGDGDGDDDEQLSFFSKV